MEPGSLRDGERERELGVTERLELTGTLERDELYALLLLLLLLLPPFLVDDEEDEEGTGGGGSVCLVCEELLVPAITIDKDEKTELLK